VLYRSYRTISDRRKQDELRRELLDYNRDDLDMLAGMLEAIQCMAGAGQVSGAAPNSRSLSRKPSARTVASATVYSSDGSPIRR
jgi:hypothetical protein